MPHSRADLVRLLNHARHTTDQLKLANQLVEDFNAQWDEHPHSAMERLEWVVKELPLALSHALARRIVENWKQKPSYRPDAGGSADHCYLSALILSANYDLADPAWAKNVLPYTLDKELGGDRLKSLPDGAEREKLVRALAPLLPK